MTPSDPHCATTTYVVQIPSTDAAIAFSRSVARRVVEFRSSDHASSFLVALTEVISNAVDEHRRIQVSDPIELHICGGDPAHLAVVDRGEGIVDADGQPATPSSNADGVRGLLLARAFVDDLSFTATPSGTTVAISVAGHGTMP